MNPADIKESSIFVFFIGNGAFFEFPENWVSRYSPVSSKSGPTAERIESIYRALTPFLRGEEPFVHEAPNGTVTCIGPQPGIVFRILPGPVFKHFLRELQMQQMMQNSRPGPQLVR